MKKFNANGKILLYTANILIVLVTILVCTFYVHRQNVLAKTAAKENFFRTVSTMQKIAQNYIQNQQDSCSEWASLISAKEHSPEEIIFHISHGKSIQNIMAFLIDYETFEGKYCDDNGKFCNVDFSMYKPILKNLFDELKRGKIYSAKITKTITNPVTAMPMVGFCQDAVVFERGKERHYALMRAVPLFLIRRQLVFPMGYEKAELSLITKDGDYIIRSPSLRNQNFWEYVRNFNGVKYGEIDEIKNTFCNGETTSADLKTSDGKYASFIFAPSRNEDWYFIGMISDSDLLDGKVEFMLVILVSIGLIMIMAINFSAFIRTNKQLALSVEETRRANLAKTSFLSSVSHDIRTPMNAIVGMTELAKRRIDDKVNVENCLEKITLASNHLLTLINDVLDISKIESGKLALNPVRFSILEETEDLLTIVRPQVQEKNIKFDVLKNNITNEYLFADAVRLNQIFTNILSNAIKYTPSGGKISMMIREDKIEGDNAKILLTYVVTDSGIGIEKEFQKTMYDTFSRAVDSRVDKIQGTGLGLAITKQMVDIMGGTIDCDSDVGKGATFTIKIPLLVSYEDEDAEKSSVGEEYSELSGLKILVAEDNDVNWEITHDLLEYYKIETTRVENGLLCVGKMKAAKEGDFDVILMDVQMPVMNGKEAAKTIRELKSDFAKKIPIIAMTADAFAEDVQSCIAAGMNGHIAKPIDLKKLLKELKKVIAAQS